MTGSAFSSVGSGRARVPRLADVVADQIRELILSGELEDGAWLPPMDRLLAQFGVSLPTMREALRMLEAEGIIAVQRGGVGGAVVHRPTPRAAAYTLALVLRSRGADKADVVSAISLLEPLAARLCARRPDRNEVVVPELRAVNAAAGESVGADGTEFNEKMLEFHRALVRLAGNETLAVLLPALEDVVLADVHSWVAAKAAAGEYPSAGQRRVELDLHERIVELIARGDEAGVANAMAGHLEGNAVGQVVDPAQLVDPKAVRSAG